MRLSKTFPPLACGVPVIYAGVGESADIIRNNSCGFVAPPENPASLADAVLNLVDAPEIRERFSRAGRKLVEREFSWSFIVSNWLRQLKQSGAVNEGDLTVDDQGWSVQSEITKSGGE
jgi:glycosyltransferase involved in cell wall biosynthesis